MADPALETPTPQGDDAHTVGTPTPEPGPTPTPGGAPESAPGPSGSVPEAGVAPGAPPAWATKRIDQLTAKWREEERAHGATRAELLARDAEIARLRATPPGATPPAAPGLVPAVAEAEIDRRADAKAEELAAKRAFDTACEGVMTRGVAEFKDFKTVLASVHTNLGVIPTPLLESIIETGELAPRIIYEMGRDLDLGQRLLGLDPRRAAMEVARLAVKLEKPAPGVSAAPEPIRPVGGRGEFRNPSLDDPNLPMDEWVKLREAKLKRA